MYSEEDLEKYTKQLNVEKEILLNQIKSLSEELSAKKAIIVKCFQLFENYTNILIKVNTICKCNAINNQLSVICVNNERKCLFDNNCQQIDGLITDSENVIQKFETNNNEMNDKHLFSYYSKELKAKQTTNDGKPDLMSSDDSEDSNTCIESDLDPESDENVNKDFGSKRVENMIKDKKSDVIQLNDERVDEISKNTSLINNNFCVYRNPKNSSVNKDLNEKNLNINAFKCEKCDESFPSKYILNSHKNLIHLNQRLKCDLKNIKFVSNHKYVCDWPECEAKFEFQSTLKKHRDSVHKNINQYDCHWPGCDAKFNDKTQLISHSRIHTGEKTYSCDYIGCEKKFNCNSDLLRHKHIHEGIKSHSCPWNGCKVSFLRSDDLKKHVISHEKGGNYIKCLCCKKNNETKQQTKQSFSYYSHELIRNKYKHKFGAKHTAIDRKPNIISFNLNEDSNTCFESVMGRESDQKEDKDFGSKSIETVIKNETTIGIQVNDDKLRKSYINPSLLNNIEVIEETIDSMKTNSNNEFNESVELLDELPNNRISVKPIELKKLDLTENKGKDYVDEILQTQDLLKCHQKYSQINAKSEKPLIIGNFKNKFEDQKLNIKRKLIYNKYLTKKYNGNMISVSVPQIDIHKKKAIRSSVLIGYECPYIGCEYRSILKQTVNNHINVKHLKILNPYKCDECDQGFPSVLKLYKHKNEVHYNQEIKCDFKGCEYVAKHKRLLSTHERAYHSSIDVELKRFVCNWNKCKRKFVFASGLKQHIDLVHKKIRKYPCLWPECDRKFDRNSLLIRHNRIHSGEDHVIEPNVTKGLNINQV